MDVMRISCRRGPVIVLGMHRSGTTMVAELLGGLGVFLGAELQADHESTFFLDANDLLLRQVNASWDQPGGWMAFLKHPEAVELTVKCLRRDVLSSQVRQYLGLKRYLRERSVEKLEGPWGWKEPRTVLTLPVWLRLFPEARLIHIVRNGVDVAASLRARERRMLRMRVETLEKRLGRGGRRPALRRAGYKGSARCLSLEGGFSLWEEYAAAGARHLAGVGNERLEVKYEEVLGDPEGWLGKLAEFCGLEVKDSASLRAAAGRVTAERAHAFAGDAELVGFYEKVRGSEWMRRYGYGDLRFEI
jgi:hypothetical protein